MSAVQIPSPRRAAGAAALLGVAAVLGSGGTAAASSVTSAPVEVFQAAGDVGGGVLEPGTTYPPTNRGFATLKRGRDGVQVNIHTSGLPAGAYTVWWIIFNEPAGCSDSCGGDDLLNDAAQTSVFFATGGVVQSNGVANFRDRYQVGDDLGDPGTQDIIGDGSLDPARAEVHNIIKYHGPASSDPKVLHEQTTTLLGSCNSGANAVDLGPVFGVHCFDPQVVAHPLP